MVDKKQFEKQKKVCCNCNRPFTLNVENYLLQFTFATFTSRELPPIMI